MTANGIAQIVLYAVILTALAYPLGIYMARVYEGTFGFVNGRLARGERLFLRLVGSSPDHEQNWKSYAGSVVVFSIVFMVLLYLLLRRQGASAAEPRPHAGRHGPDRPQHHRQLRHQHQLAVLRRRVHDVLPDADGRPGGAELRLGRGRHGRAGRRDPRVRPPHDQRISATSGSTSTARWSTSCCRCRSCWP